MKRLENGQQISDLGFVGQFGGLGDFPASAEDLKPRTLVSIRHPDDWAGVEHHIALRIENRDSLGFSTPRCRIDFGAGGVQYSADIDFINGASIIVPGAFVRVTATNPQFLAGEAVSPAKVSALLSHATGGGSGNKRAQVTTGIGTMAANSIVNVPIPDFAKSYTVVPTDYGQDSIIHSQRFAGASPAVHGIQKTTVGIQGPNPMPISSIAQVVVVENPNLAPTTPFVAVIFDIEV